MKTTDKMVPDTGGPAFPRQPTWHPDGRPWTTEQDGITARDYFAGLMLNGIAINDAMRVDSNVYKAAAKIAYEQAQAMIAEKRRLEEEQI